MSKIKEKLTLFEDAEHSNCFALELVARQTNEYGHCNFFRMPSLLYKVLKNQTIIHVPKSEHFNKYLHTAQFVCVPYYHIVCNKEKDSRVLKCKLIDWSVLSMCMKQHIASLKANSVP